ncbi:flagellin/flagellar hook associated protein [Desulfosporosinus orientis DSM 765]|uniref:Flagellin n=1 Tax=Desulfosporosinus orientis (strain ATCC 19365 / DSM 765 / NCIMB 8382 / VKM B-1628 / Singapore I) TaxID=768706 RepID=G7WIU4_DESOD|nr:flagellinolysin [Desulfosporosinus orientis]AET69168.1 flagellin/flagellar hook associated protein [Desulfosporosinus orientis DSM 765]
MRINHNVSTMNTYRSYALNSSQSQKSMGKLSSGLRINSAADDAAGLSISEKMRAQIRGMNQARRNIQDGISLLYVADGSLGEVHSLLQRGRELSVQAANGTLTTSDKQNLQQEIGQIVSGIDRIANNTEFNTIKILNVPSSNSQDAQIINGLQSSWLQQGEARILAQYGLSGDGQSLQIVMDYTPQPYLAAVSYNIDGSGKAINEQLHIDVSAFTPATLPNGGTAPVYDDRIIAHELVHAIMGRSMNFAALPTWFKEGTAEFIHGADERLFADSAGGTNFGAVVGEFSSWEGTSIDYSAAYAAVRYMHDRIKASGGTGIKDIMTYLSANPSATLDDAIINDPHHAFANLADFNTQFAANGAAYMAGMNLTNTDTGAIGGADADGGAVLDAASVIPDTVNLTSDPLVGFSEIWPGSIPSGLSDLKVQLGANTGNALTITLVDVRSTVLGLSNVDLVNQADTAITSFDSAIQNVSAKRGGFGALQNRLEHAIVVAGNSAENLTASESRIRDVDMAKEMMVFTKSNILTQAASAMLAQANQLPQGVMQLLRVS